MIKRLYLITSSFVFFSASFCADTLEQELYSKEEKVEYVNPYIRVAAQPGKCNGLVILAREGVALDNLYIQAFEYDYKKAPKNDPSWRGILRGSVALKDKPRFVTKYGDFGTKEKNEFRVYVLHIDPKTHLVQEMPAEDVVLFITTKPDYCADLALGGKKVSYAPLYMKSSQGLTVTEKLLITGGIVITLILAGLALWKGVKFAREKSNKSALEIEKDIVGVDLADVGALHEKLIQKHGEGSEEVAAQYPLRQKQEYGIKGVKRQEEALKPKPDEPLLSPSGGSTVDLGVG